MLSLSLKFNVIYYIICNQPIKLFKTFSTVIIIIIAFQSIPGITTMHYFVFLSLSKSIQSHIMYPM